MRSSYRADRKSDSANPGKRPGQSILGIFHIKTFTSALTDEAQQAAQSIIPGYTSKG
jgi:hypothetical protein